MSLTTHELGFEVLDGIEGVDSLCLFVSEDERPLKGAAGYVDWRMCGALSQIVSNAFFTGARKDCLLIPSGGRIAIPRVFALGLGNAKSLSAVGLGDAMANAARVLTRAGVSAVALEIPGAGAVSESTRAAALLNQFLPEFKGLRVAVLSEKGLLRLLANSAQMGN